MCAVKPFEVNCILLSFCACNILCSPLYRDRGRCRLSLSLDHLLVQLCASLCTVSLCEHIFPFVFGHSVRVSWFRLLHLNASVPGQCRIISEVLRCVGAGGGCDQCHGQSRSPEGEGRTARTQTSNLGDLMHRVPDNCNILQLNFTILLLLQCTFYYHTGHSILRPFL